MRKTLSCIFVFCLLLAVVSIASASSTDQKTEVNKVDTSLASSNNTIDLVALNFLNFDPHYWANICITPYGSCPLAAPMQDDLPCTCVWPNGFYSTGVSK